MRHLSQKVLHGWAATIKIGKAVKLAIVAAVVAGFFAILAPNANAVTQLEFLQWMVQLTGDNGQFSASSTPAEYVQWARSKGMNPNGGWNPSAALTPDRLAQVLVQLYGLSPRKSGGDYFRILEREGIVIDRSSSVIRRSALAALVDEFGFQSRIRIICRVNTTKKRDDDDDDGRPRPRPGRDDDDDRGGGRDDDDDRGNNRDDDDDRGGGHDRDDDDGRRPGRGRGHGHRYDRGDD